MKALTKRLGLLEQVAGRSLGIVHRIIQRVGQTQDQALDEYGRDRIAAGNLIIIRRIVASSRELEQ